MAFSIKQTTDRGYIVAGSSYSKDGNVKFNNGLDDFWIIKLDVAGHLKWQKTFGGIKHDEAYSVQQTTDGGYIVAGFADSNYYGRYRIIKLSPENLNDNLSINPYHTAPNCSSTNSISCTIKNNTGNYTVRLYRFGILYDSALNVTGHIGFS